MATNKVIYLDHAATTKVDDDVLSTYVKVVTSYYGNPASIHFLGSEAKRLIDKARTNIKDSLKLNDHEVIFLSGSSEANNLAIKGYCNRYKNRGDHIISSTIEHPAVLEVLKYLENDGFKVSYVKPESNGKIDIDKVISLIKDKTILVSIMLTNNETGATNDLDKLISIKKKYPKLVIHSDVTQAMCKIDYDYTKIDMFSFSFHKFHGLHSSGCLVKRKNIDLIPLIHGGGQENNYRSGTSDVALDYSNSKLLTNKILNIKKDFESVASLAILIYEYLSSKPDVYHLNSDISNPYIINFSLLHKKASVVVEALSNKSIMVSSISACHSSKEKGSHVIKSMTDDDNLSNNTIRVSLDKTNTKEEIQIFLNELNNIMETIK